MSTTGAPIPAGWYPDPAGGGGSRWWDGRAWTGHTLPPGAAASAGVPGAASHGPAQAASAAQVAPVESVAASTAVQAPVAQPYNAQAYAAQQTLTAPAGTNPSTPWIWLIVLIPLIGLIPLPFVDWSGLFASSMTDPSDPTAAVEAQLALYTSPAYLATIGLSWIVIAATIVFALIDFRTLTRRGVPQPFHWAWSFTALAVGGIVYIIGRSVVVRRRTGSGLAPIWAYIGVIVLSFVIGIAVVIPPMLEFFGSIASTIPTT